MRRFDPARSQVVLIGLEHYRILDSLKGVGNNVRGLQHVLADPSLGGLSDDHIEILVNAKETDDHDQDRHDSATTIGKTLARRGFMAKDMFLVYFAGHGVVDPETGDLYLAMPRTDPEIPGYTALPYNVFRASILNSNAKNKVVILDCCFSGRAATMANDRQAIDQQISVAGTVVLASCPPNSLALDATNDTEFTRFTGTLLNIMHEGIPTAGPVLTLRDIYSRLRLDSISRNLPSPRMVSTNSSSELGLVRNLAHPESTPFPIVVEWAKINWLPFHNDGRRGFGTQCTSTDCLPTEYVERLVAPLLNSHQMNPFEPSDGDAFAFYQGPENSFKGMAHRRMSDLDHAGRPHPTVDFFFVRTSESDNRPVTFRDLWRALNGIVLPMESSSPLHLEVPSAADSEFPSDASVFGEIATEHAATLISEGRKVAVVGADRRSPTDRILFMDAVLARLPRDSTARDIAMTWCELPMHVKPSMDLSFSDGSAHTMEKVFAVAPVSDTAVHDFSTGTISAPPSRVSTSNPSGTSSPAFEPPIESVAEAEAFVERMLERSRRETNERRRLREEEQQRVEEPFEPESLDPAETKDPVEPAEDNDPIEPAEDNDPVEVEKKKDRKLIIGATFLVALVVFLIVLFVT